MASSGQLIDIVSSVFGVPRPTVFAHDRNLSEAGLRSKSGRGSSAAAQTPRDAARLIISLMAAPISGPSVAGSSDACMTYAGLIAEAQGHVLPRPSGRAESIGGRWLLRGLDLPTLQALPEGHKAEDAIAGIISTLVDGSFAHAHKSDDERLALWGGGLNIQFSAPIPVITIRLRRALEDQGSDWDREEHTYFWGGSADAQSEESERRREAGNVSWDGHMRQWRAIGMEVLHPIAKVLRGGNGR